MTPDTPQIEHAHGVSSINHQDRDEGKTADSGGPEPSGKTQRFWPRDEGKTADSGGPEASGETQPGGELGQHSGRWVEHGTVQDDGRL
jgi:hypothetical protein